LRPWNPDTYMSITYFLKPRRKAAILTVFFAIAGALGARE